MVGEEGAAGVGPSPLFFEKPEKKCIFVKDTI